MVVIDVPAGCERAATARARERRRAILKIAASLSIPAGPGPRIYYTHRIVRRVGLIHTTSRDGDRTCARLPVPSFLQRSTQADHPWIGVAGGRVEERGRRRQCSEDVRLRTDGDRSTGSRRKKAEKDLGLVLWWSISWRAAASCCLPAVCLSLCWLCFLFDAWRGLLAEISWTARTCAAHRHTRLLRASHTNTSFFGAAHGASARFLEATALLW